jgi:hypothetical protein
VTEVGAASITTAPAAVLTKLFCWASPYNSEGRDSGPAKAGQSRRDLSDPDGQGGRQAAGVHRRPQHPDPAGAAGRSRSTVRLDGPVVLRQQARRI